MFKYEKDFFDIKEKIPEPGRKSLYISMILMNSVMLFLKMLKYFK